MTLIARALVGASIAAPWLALIPWHSRLVMIATASVALAAAFHGLGRVVARLARCEVDAWLAIQWGIAAVVALGGVAMALRIGGSTTFKVLVFGGVAVHGAVLIREWAPRSARLAEQLRAPERRYWLVPLALTAGLSLLYTLGAAGDLGGRPFDDDGHQLAQLKRLLDTGTLGDGLGFVREAQLGGQVVLSGVSALAGDVLLARWIDKGLCLALLLVLVVTRIRPRDAVTSLWATLLVIALSALAFTEGESPAGWSIAGMITALFFTLTERGDDERALPVALLAGALAAMRTELAPVALTGLLGVWWIRRRPWREDARRLALIVGVTSAILLPYLITRSLAWSAAPDLVPGHARWLVHAALFAGIVGVGLVVVVFGAGETLRWPALASVAGLAGIASQLTGDRPHATRFLWPIAIAFGVVVVVDLARRTQLRALGLVVALLACLLIFEGRDATGRWRWSRRLSTLAFNIEYLRHAPVPRSDYEAVLAQAAPGAVIAVWVGRPELLDYAQHRFVDLRTPRTARLRTHRWPPHASRLERLLRTTGARYLLIEEDHQLLERRRRDGAARLLCAVPHPACADDLEVIAWNHPVVATDGAVRLIDLSRGK